MWYLWYNNDGDIMENKTIFTIFTGGTISMGKDINTSKTVILDNQNELLQSIVSSLNKVNLVPHYYSMKPSPSMQISDMFELAKLINAKMDDPTIDGFVITHGTDTLEETAYFLDLFLDTKKPVVVTGSMRNFSELGYDGLSNLVSSILVATSPESVHRGVLVVLNDEINAASEVTKSHTLALDTFKSLEFGPIGIIDDETVIYYRQTHHQQHLLQPKTIHDQVEIVKAYAGASSVLLNLLIDQGIKGIVIEGLGRGNVPPQMVAGITRAIHANIPVVLTSRCPMGRVLDSYGYEGGGHHLKQLGVIFAENINGHKARIQLILATSLYEDIKHIRKCF